MKKSNFKFQNKINVHKGYAYQNFNFSCKKNTWIKFSLPKQNKQWKESNLHGQLNSSSSIFPTTPHKNWPQPHKFNHRQSSILKKKLCFFNQDIVFFCQRLFHFQKWLQVWIGLPIEVQVTKPKFPHNNNLIQVFHPQVIAI